MTNWRRCVPRSLFLAVGLLVAVPASAQISASRATPGALAVSVLCVVSERSAFPFPAGTDRCFKEINISPSPGAPAVGRLVTPMFTNVCLKNTTNGPRLTYVYSAVPKPFCGGPAAYGDPAGKEQYEPGLAALASREREFFLAQIAKADPATRK
jgi:hypothetical protein